MKTEWLIAMVAVALVIAATVLALHIRSDRARITRLEDDMARVVVPDGGQE